MNFSKQWWQDAAQAGEQVVPPITAGWDNRPRQLVPMPWPNGSCKNGPGNCFVQDPTMPQLTQHVADAMNFTVSNVKSATEANTVVIRCVPRKRGDGEASTGKRDGTGRASPRLISVLRLPRLCLAPGTSLTRVIGSARQCRVARRRLTL